MRSGRWSFYVPISGLVLQRSSLTVQKTAQIWLQKEAVESVQSVPGESLKQMDGGG